MNYSHKEKLAEMLNEVGAIIEEVSNDSVYLDNLWNIYDNIKIMLGKE